jgi:hypothetical protein
MKANRVGLYTLASVVLSLTPPMMAHADVRALVDGIYGAERAYGPTQVLTRPAGTEFTRWGTDIAVDSGYIIVLANYAGGQQALLYRRNNSDGRWVYRRALVTYTGPLVRSHVAMRNGIAAVQFDDQITLFEVASGDYVRAASDAPIRHHGGLAISGNSVLIGGDNCDYDAVIYQKGTGGSWGITGRIDDNQGECLSTANDYAVELSYDTAILRAPNGTEGRAWRRNGSAVNWVSAGILPFQPGESAHVEAAFRLQGSTAVAPNGVVWRRTGTSSWTRQGEVISVDRDNGAGTTFNVAFRDGVLVTNEWGRYRAIPHAYLETSPGLFENLAVMPSGYAHGAEALDVSGRTVVSSWRGHDSSPQLEIVRVHNLPAPLRAPAPVVNDFEDRNISDLTFSGGQFAVATHGSDEVLVQNASNGLAVALANGTDWTDYQRVAADITPTFSGSGSWVALVARYVDANNFYYLAIRDNDTYGIYKRVNGVDTLLLDRPFYNSHGGTYRAILRVTGNTLETRFSFQQGATVTDNSLTHGRGGVATWLARAEFDDLHVAATEEHELFWRDYSFTGDDYESGMHELSGTWEIREEGDEEVQYRTGLSQLDASGDAVAIIGTPVANQEIYTSMRVDSFAASSSGAWAGLVARYVDANNHYYVTMRASGQIQIRKIVNGVITVLGSANFRPVPGQYYSLRFLVINDQLQLYVDGTLVAAAHDRQIASGMYGVKSYRTKANWATFSVTQP